jgi:regulator of replication initiation timing
MEMLGILEKKIEGLITLARSLKTENDRLLTDNAGLRDKVSSLESSLLRETEKLREENLTARKTVDDLIADIDLLIETGS